MTFGKKYHGWDVAKVPPNYLEWAKDKVSPGPLQVEIYRVLGQKPPPPRKTESFQEILARVTKEVFDRFEQRKIDGKIDGEISEV